MSAELDTTKLTDEDILKRLGKAYAYLNYQSGLGHDATVQSIKYVIEALENERAERSQRSFAEEHKKKYVNYLDPIELGTLEDQIRNKL